MVYIQEIHPTDGWQVGANERDGVLVQSHASMDERVEVGQTCMLKLALELPALVDKMDDAVATAYCAMPERLYLIGANGHIVYKGDLGPIGFDPEGWERSITAILA